MRWFRGETVPEPPKGKETNSQFEHTDDDGVMITAAHGRWAPLDGVVSIGLTTPKGKHANKETRDADQARVLIKTLEDALGE